MENSAINPVSVAAPAGPYSQAVLTSGSGEWLHVAGQIGVGVDGALASGFDAQARQAWTNLVAILSASGMSVGDLVKVTTYLVDRSDMARLAPIRGEFLGEARPASTLVVAQSLAHPDWVFEVEAVAFKPFRE